MKFFFTRLSCAALLCAAWLQGQGSPQFPGVPAASPTAAASAAPGEDPEQKALNQALGEAGNSPVDFVRALAGTFDVAGKVAYVPGGYGGIGEAIAWATKNLTGLGDL